MGDSGERIGLEALPHPGNDDSGGSANSVDALLSDDQTQAASRRRSRRSSSEARQASAMAAGGQPPQQRPPQQQQQQQQQQRRLKNPEDVGQLRRPNPNAAQGGAARGPPGAGQGGASGPPGGGRGQRQLSPQEIARRQQMQADAEERERQLELKYGAEQVLALIVPVSFCMLVVVATIRSVAFFSTQDQQFVYSPYKENDSESGGERFGGALLNVIIIIGIIVVMTIFLVVLYIYKCYKVIHGWLILSSLLLLFFFGYEYVTQVLEAHNKTLDWITMALIIWNFGCVGLAVIHWRGPLIVQQAYLIAVSALMALVLIKNLPEWTTWLLLGGVAIYDLIAVLCPCGPLKMLVETAQERDEPLFPALIYSSTMAWIVTMADDDGRRDISNFSGGSGRPQGGVVSSQPRANADGQMGNPQHIQRVRDAQSHQMEQANWEEQRRRQLAAEGRLQQQQQQQRAAADDDDDEPHGVKLGLGDFIFYSVLVGKAATSDDWTTIFACYMGILVGLAATLLLLSIYQKALPALPISIFIGIIFYFATQHVLSPMVEESSLHQIFL